MKLSSMLMEHVFRQLRAQYPDSPVLIRTRQKPIQAWGERSGFTALSSADIGAVWGSIEATDDLHQWAKEKTKHGGEGYLFDPLKKEG